MAARPASNLSSLPLLPRRNTSPRGVGRETAAHRYTMRQRLKRSHPDVGSIHHLRTYLVRKASEDDHTSSEKRRAGSARCRKLNPKKSHRRTKSWSAPPTRRPPGSVAGEGEVVTGCVGSRSPNRASIDTSGKATPSSLVAFSGCPDDSSRMSPTRDEHNLGIREGAAEKFANQRQVMLVADKNRPGSINDAPHDVRGQAARGHPGSAALRV